MYAFGWNDARPELTGPWVTTGLEHAALDVAFEVEEPHQRVRFGDAQVVAGEEAKSAAPGQQVAEVLEHSIDAALEREADDDVGAVGGGELRNDVWQERVVAAGDEAARISPSILGCAR